MLDAEFSHYGEDCTFETLIKRFRERGPVLLLDGGGWAAGGPYDEDSDGDPQRDTLRTQLMRDAMRLMRYDAIVLAAAGTRIDNVALTLDGDS